MIVWYTDVEKINSQEIVHNQPLPSEFLRDRKPYSHVPLEEPKQQPQKPQPSQKPEQIPKVSRPPQQYQRDSTYRVDNLPESLWDEALTVAAQTYVKFNVPSSFLCIFFFFTLVVFLLLDITQQKPPLGTWPTLSFLYKLLFKH